jgi:hypothetical protein
VVLVAPFGHDIGDWSLVDGDTKAQARRVPMYVCVFPYLPLRHRLDIGPWELIPRDDFGDDDAHSPQEAVRARGLLDLYRVRTVAWAALSEGVMVASVRN